MEYERTRDILNHARKFHSRLQAWYEGLSGQAEKHRVKLLLAYLSRHEERLSEHLARYETHAAQEVLDTWFQYVPEEDTMQRFRAIELTPDMTVNQVVTAALKLDQYLVDLFREGARRTMSSEVREILNSLLELEEEEQLRLKRTALDVELL